MAGPPCRRQLERWRCVLVRKSNGRNNVSEINRTRLLKHASLRAMSQTEQCSVFRLHPLTTSLRQTKRPAIVRTASYSRQELDVNGASAHLSTGRHRDTSSLLLHNFRLKLELRSDVMPIETSNKCHGEQQAGGTRI